LGVLLVVACSKKKDEAPKVTPASGSVVAMPDAAAAPVAKTELLPAKLGEKAGVVFAEKQGDQVTATVKGQSVMIPDGTKVEVVSVKEAEMGADEGSVTVKFEGKDVELKPDRVLLEGLLKRSPDGKHAVFAPLVGCGDLCHSVIYLLGADGKRTKIADGSVDTSVAWQPDKVAIGDHGLWIVTLADHAVKSLEDYTSPAYSPKGVLYVRDFTGSAFTVEGDKPKRVWKAPKQKPSGDEEGDMAPEDPAPVKFDGDKPKFDLAP
jgi:hypothetical protein